MASGTVTNLGRNVIVCPLSLRVQKNLGWDRRDARNTPIDGVIVFGRMRTLSTAAKLLVNNTIGATHLFGKPMNGRDLKQLISDSPLEVAQKEGRGHALRVESRSVFRLVSGSL